MFLGWWTACHRDVGFGDGPAITHLAIREVPNPLAVEVTFRTSHPAVGAVAYGRDGRAEWQVSEDRAAEDHALIVFGLFAQETFDLEIVATDPDGGVSRTAPQAVSTGPVLDGLSATLLAQQVVPDEWTLLDLFDAADPVNRAVLVDGDGQIRWLYEGARGEGPGALDVSLTPDGRILMGGSVATGSKPVAVDLAGNVQWEGVRQPGFEEDGYQHHHLAQVDASTMVGLEKDVRDGIRGDRLIARDLDGNESWRWSTWDWFATEPDETEQTHLNWLQLDTDVFYVSDYAADAIWKIDRASGEPTWRLGWGGAFSIAAGGAFFEQQHAPEIEADGRWTVYDNGEDGGPSRVVTYALDEDAGTATQVWSFDGGDEWGWFTGYWGDVDRLGNGNLLVSAGNLNVRRTLEVSPEQEVVWALEWPPGYGSYRAERVDPSRWGWTPLVP